MSSVYVCEDQPSPVDPSACVVWVAQPYQPSPFALTLPEAQSIGLAILGVWAVAFGIRVLARLVRELG